MKKNITKWVISFSLFAAAVILILSLVSFVEEDFFLYTSHPTIPPENLIGILGVYIAGFLTYLLGYASYLVIILLIVSGLRRLELVKTEGYFETRYTALISLIITIISLSLLLSLSAKSSNSSLSFQRGGLLGYVASSFFLKYLGFTGASIVGTTFFIIGIILLEGEIVISGFHKMKAFLNKAWANLKEKRRMQKAVNKEIKETKSKFKIRIPKPEDKLLKEKKPFKEKAAPPKVTIAKPSVPQPKKEEKPIISKIGEDKEYTLPSFILLKEPPSIDQRKIKEDIELNAKNLEETLSDFGIEARVVNVERGPVVTRYELEPAPGVKINRISSLADDIALSLKSTQVRVVAPIPGKGTVGVEVPNTVMHIVYLQEVITDKNFTNSKSKLTLSIGKDVAGTPLVADLKDMPHLLIAGTTGSGKTVCVNSLISSILFKAAPWEVKFLLIDPKMVELVHFADIPHLLAPIVSDAKKAKGILLWATEEMEKRYGLLAEEGARNIDAYNSRKAKEEQMPFIVIVIDELADLMIAARDEIETAILRLAQLSRAVGIHLILATQRPSVDVVTGVIKANFPARISFKVASKVDSRTVLDMVGAEKLLGRGDLLFIKPGVIKPIRAQSCFVDDEDISTLVDFVKQQGRPQYNQQILELQKKTRITLEKDELLDEAIKVILESNQASASILQRRLRVGYTRAARLLDLMEQEGIVGPFQGSKAREILTDRDEYLKQFEEKNSSSL
ncbi:MAG: DNA translocase FtsK 4TM domain-containing protein [Candidatus Omnitrophica bacterium]|nr:DNA translocase FtsK 4TM domain-containing protein [Candidatus Omnitrophota bacterium]